MKWIYTILAAVFALSSCSSPKSGMDRGNYDQVVYKVTERLMKNKKVKDEELYMLEEAYNKALERDKIKIQQLKSSGNSANWVEIFNIYTQLQKRQDLAIRVNPLQYANGNSVTLPVANISPAREEAREMSAAHYYNRGVALLESRLRSDAREAYSTFNKVYDFYKDYKDVRDLQAQAHERGTAHILLVVDQNPNLFLPQNFASDLLSVDYNRMVSEWIQFYTDSKARTKFDYAVKLNITESYITPGTIKEHFCDEQKEIENGWQYVYDSRGNVKKDSLGNDIKVPKYILVTARLIETQMFRSSGIRGVAEIFNYQRGNLLKSIPAQGTAEFNHYSAVLQGDKRALSPESLKKLGNSPAPFPNDLDMILLANNELKKMYAQILRDNQRIFNTDGI